MDLELNHLTEEERDRILNVLRRDEDLRAKDLERIRQLKIEVKKIRLKGVIKEGVDPDKTCARCREKFGWLFNKGALCPQCSHRVCEKCRLPLPKDDTRWLCILCSKQTELDAMSGQWFLMKFRKSKRNKKTNKVITGQEIVKTSIMYRPSSTDEEEGVEGSGGGSDGNKPPALEKGRKSLTNNNSSPKSSRSVGSGSVEESSDTQSTASTSPGHKKRLADVHDIGFPKESDRQKLLDLIRSKAPVIGSTKESSSESTALTVAGLQKPTVEVRKVSLSRYRSDSESSSSESAPSSPQLSSARTDSEFRYSDSIRSSIRSTGAFSAISSEGRMTMVTESCVSDIDTNSIGSSVASQPDSLVGHLAGPYDKDADHFKSSDSVIENKAHRAYHNNSNHHSQQQQQQNASTGSATNSASATPKLTGVRRDTTDGSVSYSDNEISVRKVVSSKHADSMSSDSEAEEATTMQVTRAKYKRIPLNHHQAQGQRRSRSPSPEPPRSKTSRANDVTANGLSSETIVGEETGWPLGSAGEPLTEGGAGPVSLPILLPQAGGDGGINTTTSTTESRSAGCPPGDNSSSRRTPATSTAASSDSSSTSSLDSNVVHHSSNGSGVALQPNYAGAGNENDQDEQQIPDRRPLSQSKAATQGKVDPSSMNSTHTQDNANSNASIRDKVGALLARYGRGDKTDEQVLTNPGDGATSPTCSSSSSSYEIIDIIDITSTDDLDFEWDVLDSGMTFTEVDGKANIDKGTLEDLRAAVAATMASQGTANEMSSDSDEDATSDQVQALARRTEVRVSWNRTQDECSDTLSVITELTEPDEDIYDLEKDLSPGSAQSISSHPLESFDCEKDHGYFTLPTSHRVAAVSRTESMQSRPESEMSQNSITPSSDVDTDISFHSQNSDISATESAQDADHHHHHHHPHKRHSLINDNLDDMMVFNTQRTAGQPEMEIDDMYRLNLSYLDETDLKGLTLPSSSSLQPPKSDPLPRKKLGHHTPQDLRRSDRWVNYRNGKTPSMGVEPDIPKRDSWPPRRHDAMNLHRKTLMKSQSDSRLRQPKDIEVRQGFSPDYQRRRAELRSVQAASPKRFSDPLEYSSQRERKEDKPVDESHTASISSLTKMFDHPPSYLRPSVDPKYQVQTIEEKNATLNAEATEDMRIERPKLHEPQVIEMERKPRSSTRYPDDRTENDRKGTRRSEKEKTEGKSNRRKDKEVKVLSDKKLERKINPTSASIIHPTEQIAVKEERLSAQQDKGKTHIHQSTTEECQEEIIVEHAISEPSSKKQIGRRALSPTAAEAVKERVGNSHSIPLREIICAELEREVLEDVCDTDSPDEQQHQTGANKQQAYSAQKEKFKSPDKGMKKKVSKRSLGEGPDKSQKGPGSTYVQFEFETSGTEVRTSTPPAIAMCHEKSKSFGQELQVPDHEEDRESNISTKTTDTSYELESAFLVPGTITPVHSTSPVGSRPPPPLPMAVVEIDEAQTAAESTESTLTPEPERLGSSSAVVAGDDKEEDNYDDDDDDDIVEVSELSELSDEEEQEGEDNSEALSYYSSVGRSSSHHSVESDNNYYGESASLTSATTTSCTSVSQETDSLRSSLRSSQYSPTSSNSGSLDRAEGAGAGRAAQNLRSNNSSINTSHYVSYDSLDVLIDDESDTAEERANPSKVEEDLALLSLDLGPRLEYLERTSTRTPTASFSSNTNNVTNRNRTTRYTANNPHVVVNPSSRSAFDGGAGKVSARGEGDFATEHDNVGSYGDQSLYSDEPASSLLTPATASTQHRPIPKSHPASHSKQPAQDGSRQQHHHNGSDAMSVTSSVTESDTGSASPHVSSTRHHKTSISSVPSINVTQHDTTQETDAGREDAAASGGASAAGSSSAAALSSAASGPAAGVGQDASGAGNGGENSSGDQHSLHSATTGEPGDVDQSGDQHEDQLSTAAQSHVSPTHSIQSQKGGNILSPFSGSKESIVSFYSDAGEGNYGNIPIQGDIQFALDYNYKTGSLEVRIKQCRDLAPVDTKKKRSDPYVKVYLLPDKTKSGKRKTRVKKHTLNPVFDETLKYAITKSELETRTLWLTVWHSDMFGRNDFLGEVTLPLDYYQFGDLQPQWYKLQERTRDRKKRVISKENLLDIGGRSQEPKKAPKPRKPVAPSLSFMGMSTKGAMALNHRVTNASPMSLLTYKGDLMLSLRYVTGDNVPSPSGKVRGGGNTSKRRPGSGELHVLLKEARNLTAVRANGFSDPFCKGYLLPDKGRNTKQKTPVSKRDCNPQWNHTFVFEDVSLEDLRDRSLELTVWDHDRFTSNDFLGGIRLNIGTGKVGGKEVDWMDSRGEEISMWQSMLDRPNCWIDGSLMLRSTMERRK